ncbi:MAG: ABC transporter permease, partial [Spirochaetota bacterium]
MRTFILRRIIILIPLFIVISMFVFMLIQLPPGSYIDNYIMELRQQGQDVGQAEIETLTRMYGLDQPIHVQYLRWFSGFMTGDLGYSLAMKQPVSEIIMSRLGYTVLIMVLVIVFQWVVSIPIGLYSAVYKYTVGDYIVTFLGFIGLSIPNFMLALIIMYVGYRYFGANLTGLFSIEFVNQPWSFAKFLDMLSNIWVAVIVVGTAGTASFIRVLRSQ